MDIQPTRPQPVLGGHQPPYHPYPPHPSYAPRFVPTPPPQHQAPRPRWSRRRMVLAGGITAGVAFGIACGIVALSTSGGSSSAVTGASPHCYATVTDAWGTSVSLAVLGTSDCTAVASDVLGNMPSSFSDTPNTVKGPGSAVCTGFMGKYAVSVISTVGWNAVCQDNAFTALP